VRAAILGVGAVIGSGCLLPQEDGVLQPFVLPNNPPRIKAENAEPPKNTTIGVDGCRKEFKVPVEDPDVDDRVQSRWYVDYDFENDETNTPTDEITLENTGEAVRGPATKTFTNGPFGELATAGTHVVTLMVFDGELGVFDGPNSIPRSRPIPGFDGGNPTYSDSYDWIVFTDPAVQCP
jgi:hypothetical protein